MIIDFLKAKEFGDFEVFLFLGFPKGFTINKTFLIQFIDHFKEIEGDFNIVLEKVDENGNLLYGAEFTMIT